MTHHRPALPRGHGEVLVEPAFEAWAELAERNARAADAWAFGVGGAPVRELRALARAEALERARTFSSRLGVPLRDAPAGAPLAMTGHQPDLYHPGAWAKVFLLDRFAAVAGAHAIDLIVDSDGFAEVSATMPCMRPTVGRCRHVLAPGSADGCYACAPPPDAEAREAFRAGGLASLATLPAPSPSTHFATFCDVLDAAAGTAGSLAEAVTIARRRYEEPAATAYLELPVTEQAQGGAFHRFAAELAARAHAFAQAYNAELAAYRAANGVRSPAQPFPDLAEDAGEVELPLWALGDGRRRALGVRYGSGRSEVLADGEAIASAVTGGDTLAAALAESGVGLAPKALALTLFNRMFVADLFIHGVGGAGYDQVTDGVIRRFFGVEPPEFVTASLTLYLPLGARLVSDAEYEAAERRLQRLEHNPDEFLGEAVFDSADERLRALELAERKRELVERIASPDADRKALGGEIREVNVALAELLAPVVAEAREERDRLSEMRAAYDVLTDRTYPFCLWSPLEVADKVR